MSAHLTNQEIYDRVYDAISERRLAPGTKLNEERLAQAFQASRTRIREVLMRLSQEFVIELLPNRGAVAVKLTEAEWFEGIRFLTETGQLALRYAEDIFGLGQEFLGYAGQIVVLTNNQVKVVILQVSNDEKMAKALDLLGTWRSIC